MTPETYGTKLRHPAIRPAIQALENAAIAHGFSVLVLTLADVDDSASQHLVSTETGRDYDLFEGILGVLALAGAPVSLASVAPARHFEIDQALAQEAAGDGREAAALRDRFVDQIRQVMGAGEWVETEEPAGEGREPDGAG